MQPDATLGLRQLAESLSERTQQKIHPVSLQHADRINPELLGGVPAQVFSEFIKQQLESGEREFLLLPLFFGESRALTSFIPGQVGEFKTAYGDFQCRVAEVLHPMPDGEPLLASILRDHVVKVMQDKHVSAENVVLVDHGSPIVKVNEVRQRLAVKLQDLLGDNIVVEQAAMERRPGKEYDFNGPLLEDWLTMKAEQGQASAIVALLFLLPGRHAGKSGDIETICAGVMNKYPEFTIGLTPLISDHGDLIVILESRLQAALLQ
jgi:sirohydrochlorin ferrochelatase